MKGLTKILMGVMCLTMLFQGCSDDDSPTSSTTDTNISTPATYEFPSRFINGESSVMYTGQTVRNVLTKDLKSLAGTNESTEASLLDLYTNNNGACSAANIINAEKQTTWADFDGNCKNLSGKIASDALLGYGLTPDAQMKAWFAEVPNLISHPGDPSRFVQSADSLELNQMIGKGLLGVVAYYQGTSVYMSKMEDDAATNGAADGSSAYSSMEHHWDESFGYFGAAKDYNTYTDDAARKSSYDSNGDNLIDYMSEYNFAWATYAAKRDIDCAATCTVDNDFTGTIMSAYLEGRTLIHNQGSLTDIVAQRTIIVNAWEKMVAANIIHYANSVKETVSSGSGSMVHAWAEMRAFAMALQYNQYKLISDADLASIITLMGTAPPASSTWTDYATSMNTVVSTLKSAYSFADVNVAAW